MEPRRFWEVLINIQKHKMEHPSPFDFIRKTFGERAAFVYQFNRDSKIAGRLARTCPHCDKSFVCKTRRLRKTLEEKEQYIGGFCSKDCYMDFNNHSEEAAFLFGKEAESSVVNVNSGVMVFENMK